MRVPRWRFMHTCAELCYRNSGQSRGAMLRRTSLAGRQGEWFARLGTCAAWLGVVETMTPATAGRRSESDPSRSESVGRLTGAEAEATVTRATQARRRGGVAAGGADAAGRRRLRQRPRLDRRGHTVGL